MTTGQEHFAERSNDAALRLAKLAALFCSMAACLYTAADIGPSVPLLEWLVGFGPLLGVVMWLQGDARRTRVGSVLDLGYFLLLAWPVVIPWYAFKTRGRSGWRLVATLFGLICAPYISAAIVEFLMWYFDARSY
jgi:hypothetical protein